MKCLKTDLDPAFRSDKDLVSTPCLSNKIAEQLFVVSSSVHHGRVPKDASELDGFGQSLLAVFILCRSITHGEAHGTAEHHMYETLHVARATKPHHLVSPYALVSRI
jgi:hypothetical protein